MSYQDLHKKACRDLAHRIDAYLKEAGISEHRFCKEAGAHSNAMRHLREYKVRPVTMDQLDTHLAQLRAADCSEAAE